MEDEIKPNPEVKLQEYKIISKYLEKNDQDETSKDIQLPTPESLEKIFSSKIVQDSLTFDIKKFTSFLEKGEKEEMPIINLDKIKYIQNGDILPYLLLFLGGINSVNDIYDFFDESVKIPNERGFVDNSLNFLDYLNSVIEYLKQNDKVTVLFIQLDILLNSLNELGINIKTEKDNTLYRSIKDSYLSLDSNKILVILAPSNNFWIKSPKNSINGENYDIKLNNYNNIFYNKKFIEKFLSKITKHVRCTFGLLCSMSYKNLKNCWDGLEKQFSDKCPKKVIFLDQKVHEEIKDPKQKKPSYYRNMKKILEFLKKDKDINKNREKEEEEGENAELFSEKNILIIESEEEKMNDTKSNSIFVSLFNEEYLEKDEQGKGAIDLEGDKVINYVYKLLETCTDDIRDYINRNKITDEYSRV